MNYNVPFLAGERIYLRSLIDSDAWGNYLYWFNEAEVCSGNSHHVYPFTVENARDYIKFANTTRDNLILAVVAREGDKHMGNIALQDISTVYRSAAFSIMIGYSEAWGKGYGYEAARLIINHGFGALNLHRISCATFDNNPGMIGLANKLGFTEEGRRREAAFKETKYLNVIEYGLLREEWK